MMLFSVFLQIMFLNILFVFEFWKAFRNLSKNSTALNQKYFHAKPISRESKLEAAVEEIIEQLEVDMSTKSNVVFAVDTRLLLRCCYCKHFTSTLLNYVSIDLLLLLHNYC